MKGLIERLSTTFEQSGLQVKLFEYDIEDETSFNELKEYLYAKIRNSKLHNEMNYDINYYSSQNMNNEFIEKLNKSIKEITIPQTSRIPQFSVQRERVTEWMAELLLKEKYDCLFYDEADKRMNIDPININKHTPGIDVPGIYIKDGQIKFVVCEVKASDLKSKPSSTIKSLNEDIKKSIKNQDSRVSREILQYMHSIKQIQMTDELLDKIIKFLVNLIAEKDEIVNNVMFFPVLIRSEGSIVKDLNIDDFSGFKLNDVDKNSVKNILLVLQKNLNEFSQEIYNEALNI